MNGERPPSLLTAAFPVEWRGRWGEEGMGGIYASASTGGGCSLPAGAGYLVDGRGRHRQRAAACRRDAHICEKEQDRPEWTWSHGACFVSSGVHGTQLLGVQVADVPLPADALELDDVANEGRRPAA